MTITLNQAQKLHELGVRRESDFYYCSYKGEQFNKHYKMQIIQNTFKYVYSAYNAEELFSMIEGGYDINVCEEKTVQVAAWYDVYQGCEYFRANTLTEALANKLIFDLENGIISVEEINK